MTLERGLRRILTAVSFLLVGSGTLLAVLLGAAWMWSLHLDRDRISRMAAEGCPAEGEPKPASPTVVRLSPTQWRVALPQKGYMQVYIVNTQRLLTENEITAVAEKRVGAVDAFQARWHPAPDVEVVDCISANQDIVSADGRALSNQLYQWWSSLPLVLFTLLPVIRLDTTPVVFAGSAIALPFAVAVAPVAAAWGLFYLLRWIARGFTGG